MNKHQKFLEFNGKNIIFLNVDGVYWIALKPICEALEIEYTRSFKNVKNDPILGSALAVQPMQVSKNGKSQLRNMTCIPEKYIYGWIFSLQSESVALLEYKRTCYDLLYNHFHGTITNRKDLVQEKNNLQEQIHELELELLTDARYKTVLESKKKIKKINNDLNKADKELIQPDLFTNQN